MTALLLMMWNFFLNKEFCISFSIFHLIPLLLSNSADDEKKNAKKWEHCDLAICSETLDRISERKMYPKREREKNKFYTARTQRRVDDTTEKKFVTSKYEAWMLMSRDVHCTCTIIHSIHSIYVDDFHTIWILNSIFVFVRVHVRKMHIFITKTTKKMTHTNKKNEMAKWKNLAKFADSV